MTDRFAERLGEREVAHDVRILADFTAIWCDAHHRDRERRPALTDAATLGAYRWEPPVLCAECEAHLAYAEKRRAYCPKTPKPFCSHCDTHCYSADEVVWQREMMRYSGPRSWRRGHAIDGIKHMIEAVRHRRETAHRASAPAVADDQPE